MSDSNENTISEVDSTTPGVPIVDGRPFEPEPETQSADSSENVAQGAPGEGLTPDVTPESTLSEDAAGEPLRASEKLSGNSARMLAKEVLTKQGITPLRCLATLYDITVELPGKSDLVDKVVEALTIPGLFSLEGANQGSAVVTVRYMPDGLGGVARTVIVLDRRLV